MKKALIVLLIAFVVYFLLAEPDGMADVFTTIFDFFGDLFDAIITFFEELF
ncbi:hypothetical protein [Phytoactinopolyspora endophytica]|uniref:hypothetical protein n=1 Tax=Phytoactinopolyspora endophytica TaxID=1642495 RepID=UPI0013EA6BC3|nr:hypothetical protein [Phytoactinopolyspora endophytica]